jgi:hypothetical protein
MTQRRLEDHMDYFQKTRVKWPYVTHLVDRRCVQQILPVEDGRDVGALMLARVTKLGRHGDLEAPRGRRLTLFVGDVFVGVLGDRYATGQFEGAAVVSGGTGHVVSIGGVVGQVVSMNTSSPPPTQIDFLGRLADDEGRPLYLRRFQALPLESHKNGSVTTILSLGAGMDSGKTTTAAHLVRSLTNAGHAVGAAKLTGTACGKDANLLYDAGAVAVLDFTHAGWPSTANLSLPELMSISDKIRAALAEHEPEFVILEIADGVVQRETGMMLADPDFRDSIDAVVYSGRGALSCEAGVSRIRALGYTVLATAGPVANSRLGLAEAEACCGVPCFGSPDILGGKVVPLLRSLAERRRSAPAA